MKQIGTKIFETYFYSSSIHSISMLRCPLPKNIFPINEHIILELNDYVPAGAKVFYRTSLGKLSFLINLLIIYVAEHLGNCYIKTYDDFIKWLPYTWLEEVVYEMTRSTFEISKDYIIDEFPFLKYYKRFLPNLDDSGILRLFRCIRENNKDIFKETVNIIIFDDDVVIIDEEYYNSERCVVWEK